MAEGAITVSPRVLLTTTLSARMSAVPLTSGISKSLVRINPQINTLVRSLTTGHRLVVVPRTVALLRKTLMLCIPSTGNFNAVPSLQCVDLKVSSFNDVLRSVRRFNVGYGHVAEDYSKPVGIASERRLSSISRARAMPASVNPPRFSKL